MLRFNLTTGLSLTGALLMTTAALAAGGMKKHDASIANYNYNVPIIETQAGGTGNLKQDMDQGKVSDTPVVAPAAAPMMQQAPMAAVAATPALQVGTQAPEFQLPNAQGQIVSLSAASAQGPVMVLFVRSLNDSASMRQLQLIQKNLPQFAKLNANVIAITPEAPAALQNAPYGFLVVSDAGGQVAQQYGAAQGNVLYTISGGTVAAVQQSQGGFDLNEATAPLFKDGGHVSAPQAAPAAAAQKLVAVDPQPATTVPMEAKAVTVPVESVKETVAAPVLPPPQTPVEEMAPAAGTTAEAMPAMPSPSADAEMQAKPMAYHLPPSHPDFLKSQDSGLMI